MVATGPVAGARTRVRAVARRRRQAHELERVLGANALFATAYGNVGSSIYYALGVTAAFALGLTPVVFVIAGLFFAATAATYAEGTVQLPRGRRLVELRAPRLQRGRLVRGRLGADAQLHHHDRHLGVLRAALPLDLLGAAADEPVGHHRRRRRHRLARRAQHRRRSRSRRRSTSASRRSTSRRRSCSFSSGSSSSSTRTRSSTNVHFGRCADVEPLPARDPDRDDRVHGDRDRLEPLGGGARPACARSRARSSWSRSRSSRSTSRCR